MVEQGVVGWCLNVSVVSCRVVSCRVCCFVPEFERVPDEQFPDRARRVEERNVKCADVSNATQKKLRPLKLVTS